MTENWSGHADNRKTLDKPRVSPADLRTDTKYLGVLALLGRLARHLPKGHEDRYGVERAFADANQWLEARDSTLRFQKSSDGGYAAFEQPGEPALMPERASCTPGLEEPRGDLESRERAEREEHQRRLLPWARGTED